MSVELAGAIRRSVSGPMWHGSALDELLRAIDHRQAAARPVADAHTIWEIVLHIALWTDVARRRVQGERVTPTDAEDWPKVQQTSSAAWIRDRTRLQSSHEELAALVSRLSPAALDSRVPKHEYSVRTMLNGVIEHDCYHGGQIALLKKALRSVR